MLGAAFALAAQLAVAQKPDFPPSRGFERNAAVTVAAPRCLNPAFPTPCRRATATRSDPPSVNPKTGAPW